MAFDDGVYQYVESTGPKLWSHWWPN